MLDISRERTGATWQGGAALIRALKWSIRDRLPDWLFAIDEWHQAHGVFPHVLRPRSFNEKILHRIIFDRRPILAQFADKLAVRSYVEQRLGTEILPKLYCVTADPQNIPFDVLPERFVVKPTHGSGWVRLIADKSKLDRADLMRTCRGWLRQSFYKMHREWAYKNVEPRILVEEYIDDGNAVPDDYKLFVFDGVVRFLHVDRGRFSNHRRRFFTPDWQDIEARFGDSQKIAGPMPAPANLTAMIAAAETLGRGLDFVRADFYDTGKRLYFGELTMTPGCGQNRFEPRELDLQFGAYWKQRTR